MHSFAVLLAAIVCALRATAHAQEIVTLSTRPNVTQSYFLARVPADAQAVAILFTGGEGHIRLRSEGGRIRFSAGNFLVRVRADFVNRKVIVAIPDVPSDQSASGMDDAFRLGERHAADIRAVAVDLARRFPGLPLFLIGTSRGTVSAAAAGRSLRTELSGVVLTSTVFVPSRPGPGLRRFDFSAITAPLLLVHHAADGCHVTPYREARSLADRRKYPLITVKGGLPPTSGPCDPFSAHGFLGKESETVEAMVNWMLKKSHASNIE